MSKQLDRARDKHRQLVSENLRLSAREQKLLDELMRLRLRKHKSASAVARSQKRLDKLVAAAQHNAGPLAHVVPELMEAIRPV